MESVAARHPQLAHDPDASETAFLAGTLSVLDVMLDIPMEKLVKDLNLHEKIGAALLSRTPLPAGWDRGWV